MKKYVQIYNTIKEKITSGEYKAGSKLPSKRILADRFGVSVITAETAYNMLADEGYIEPKERSGYYVCRLEMLPPTQAEAPAAFTRLPEPKQPVTRDFEFSIWFKTVRKVLSEKGEQLFVKSPNKGLPALRNALADYLYRYRNMCAEPSRIIIGSGSEQLYETAVKLLGRDKLFGIENPSYPQIEAVYKSAGAAVCHLDMGTDGISLSDLKAQNPDVLHVTPFRSYPTGVTTSIVKRYAYLSWASGGKYIVEDDFNSEFFMPGQPIQSLYALDRADRVLYINTFSKSLSPSMRIGYMILPKHLLPVYEEVLGRFSCSVPVLDQFVLSEFIGSGDFERHLNRIRRRENLKNFKKKLDN